jgi:hypothetical protein
VVKFKPASGVGSGKFPVVEAVVLHAHAEMSALASRIDMDYSRCSLLM